MASNGTGRPRSNSTVAPIDPILRNTLRYTVSAHEYAALHKYILSRSRMLKRSAPSPANVERALQPKKTASGRVADDFNVRAVRHALRVFVVTFFGMKGYEAIMQRLTKEKEVGATGKGKGYLQSPALRLSVSLSTILLLYRLLFRFLTRLRAHLMDASVEPFRRRNPRTSATLTSPYAPVVGASLAGLALGIYPSQQLRVSVAIYTIFRALEFGWNCCEEDGMIWGVKNGRKRERPWWFGSWMLQPLAFGQLFSAIVFDRDCFPAQYGDIILKNSSAYFKPRPADWPKTMRWPNLNRIMDSLSEMARLNWPAYISPTMFPHKEIVLPPTLADIGPLTSRAHPLIKSLSCATLHPGDPSCLRTYFTFWLNTFPPLIRLCLLYHTVLTILPRFKSLYHSPVTVIHKTLASALQMSTFVIGSISTAWASICFFQRYLPRHVLARQRFFLGGFLAGLWAWVGRADGRNVALHCARMSVDSLWKVGVKRRWWKAMKGGDVWLFVLALMITGMVYEKDASAIREGSWKKGMSWVRGEGWRDWSIEEEEEEEEAEKEKDE